MADYNIYGIKRKDTNEYIYIGMTEREYDDRWVEHKRAVGGIYKRNCAGGKKGEVRNPNTPYGMEANKPLYHFIRNELDGEKGLETLWTFEELSGDDKMTEHAWIDLALSWGHKLFNMVDGQGEFVTERTYKDVDLTGCETVKEAINCIVKWKIEQVQLEQLRKAERLAAKKLREATALKVKEEEFACYMSDKNKITKSVNALWDRLEELVLKLQECDIDVDWYMSYVDGLQQDDIELSEMHNGICEDIADLTPQMVFTLGQMNTLKKRMWKEYFALVAIIEKEHKLPGLFGGNLK